MVTKVRGNFAEVTGTIEITEQPEQSSVDVVIGAASIDTRSPDRDGHLKSADFLDVERFPELRYRSTGVRRNGRTWQLDGELTVRDVTRPVVLDVEFEGSATDPWGGSRISFTAKGELDREDFGITWNQALETGGVLVSRKVQIELDVQAVRQ
jgi:polyisoprenoid-binding protein YceI